MFLSLLQPAGVAQLVEQRTENPRVGGSIPSPGTTQESHKVPQSVKSFAGLCFSRISQSRHVSKGALSSLLFAGKNDGKSFTNTINAEILPTWEN